MQIVELAPAKVNLWLRVFGKMADGYHQVETVLQTISFADTLILAARASGITLTCSNPHLPCNEHNLAYRAAQLLAEAAPGQGVHIHLEKRIPWRAGLGGGSSDAAAVLRGLNRLWGLNWPWHQLVPLAQTLGADVPFFLRGGTAIGRGRGDELELLTVRPELSLILIQPPFGLATPDVYSCWQSIKAAPAGSLEDLLSALGNSDSETLGRLLYNDLEVPAFQLAPQLAEVKQRLSQAGLPCLLSGSGACLFAVVPRVQNVPAIGWLQRIRRLLPANYMASLVRTSI